MSFKVMTFNIRGAFRDDGENVWEKRRDLNIATIKKYAPDIIGFQEAQRGNLDDYKVALNDYDVEAGVICTRETELQNERVPLYWKRERFEKLDSGTFYLSETPEVESIGWTSGLVRAVTWVKLRDKTANVAFVVLNTHFPHEQAAEETRMNCANMIVEQLTKIARDLPQIVMADFNTQPASDAYEAFMKNGYVDTYTAAGHTGTVNTYHGFQGDDYDWDSDRIDWILARDAGHMIISKSAQVIVDAEPPLYPSDHYPVIAELELR